MLCCLISGFVVMRGDYALGQVSKYILSEIQKEHQQFQLKLCQKKQAAAKQAGLLDVSLDEASWKKKT